MKLTHMLVGASALALVGGSALAQDDDPAVAVLDAMNAQLAADGSNLSIFSMELLGSGEGLNMGRTVRASDHGNKQLSSDWALNDPNRGFRTNITYAIDTAETTPDFPSAEQADVVRFGVETWDEETCSNIGISEVPAPAADLGFVSAFFFGGADFAVPGFVYGADIVHAGFKSQPFWDIIACGVPGSGCGNGILGVNFTLVWVGTDYDNNGRADVAIKESYYNDEFTWVNDGVLGERGDGVFDFATVALHESGHALSRAHFGDVAIHHKKGLTTSPDAVMNAIYGGVKRELLGPDQGGHCSDWSAWPTQN